MTQVISMTATGEGYEELRLAVRRRFDGVAASGAKLFTTDATGLYDAFLEHLPPELRQRHNCHACRHFVDRLGGLVTIDETGATSSPLWEPTDDVDFRASVLAVHNLVARAKVTGIFLSKHANLGTEVTGGWRHFAVTLPQSMVHRDRLLTPGQAMAAKRDDFATLCRALAEFKPQTLRQAVTLLEADALYRSEKVLGCAKWLLELHTARQEKRGPARDNLTWLAISGAPQGWCHPRSSMIGTLLEDIDAGLPLDDVRRKFTAKMHPLQYQRPQAAPSAGNIAEAERIVEKLGIADSLKRRFARLDEIEAVWRPHPAEPTKDGGVFAHLKPKGAESTELKSSDATPITLDKFLRAVLPNAEEVEVYAPLHGNFIAILTAEVEGAPLIFQWDNTFSNYVYNNGSAASSWNIRSGWHKAQAITLSPHEWGGGKLPHMGRTAIFVIDGCRDLHAPSLGLFPETLKSELRAIRSTIEAFSRAGKPSNTDGASACGLAWQSGAPVTVRVTTGGVTLTYKIDRLD